MDAQLSRRAWKAVGYPPLSDIDPELRREFQAALIEAESFEDLPGKWQAAPWSRRRTRLT
jgi:hypothetical protein